MDGRRQRLSRADRYRQLIETAWSLVRSQGTEALSLGRLAETAGVAKPVVYDHFRTRTGLLIALYQEFDTRQNLLIDAALSKSSSSLASLAQVLASAYIECVLAQGREIPGIIAALSGSPELQIVKAKAQSAFRAKCREALAPFAKSTLDDTRLTAMLGAAEALAGATARGEIERAAGQAELAAVIFETVSRK